MLKRHIPNPGPIVSESTLQILTRARELLKSRCAEAIVLVGQARVHAAAEADHRNEAAALNLHARILTMLGRHDAALLLLQQVSDMASVHAIDEHQGEAVQLRGRIYYRQSRYRDARQCWLDCLEMAPPVIDQHLLARACLGLGCLEFIQGHHQAALDYHNRAQELALESDDPLLFSEAQLRMAGDWIKMGQCEPALLLLKEALVQIKAAKHYPQEATVYGLIGEIHYLNGEIEKAHANLMLALKLNRLHDRAFAEISNLRLLGFCDLQRQEIDGAFDFLNTAHALASNCGSQYLLAQTEQALAMLCSATGQNEAAAQHQLAYQRLRDGIHASLDSTQ